MGLDAGFPWQLRRPSLGRIAHIGEAYDVRSENFTSLSLLNSTSPNNLIQRVAAERMELEYEFTENLSDRFKLLEVGGELQLSVLLGLIELEGSGKYLQEEKKSDKTLSCSFMCRIQTVSEKLFGSAQEILEQVDLQMLKNPRYTHMITEINWGANFLMNLEFACSSESKKKDIQGKLGVELSKIKVAVKSGGSLKKLQSNLFEREDLKIKVFTDIVPEGVCPTTVESFLQFLEGIPKLLSKVNEGKGKPLNYTMIPLSALRELAGLEMSIDSAVKEIEGGFLKSTTYFIDEIWRLKQKLHDFYTLVKANQKYLKDGILKTAEEMEKNLTIKEADLKTLISRDWVAIRSGKKQLDDLILEVEKFKFREFNLFTYEEYLAANISIVDKLSAVSKMLTQGIKYLGRGEKLETLQIEYPKHDFIVLVTSSETEKADEELHTNTLIYFRTLAAEKKPNTTYAVVDFDLNGERTFYNTTITVTQCFHIRGITVVSRDLYAQHLAEIEGDFVRPSQNSRTELCRHKPAKRVVLEIPCPSFRDKKCSKDAVIWNCFVCKSNVEYGFDNFYYCSCGRTPIDNFEYRCSNPMHGGSFIRAPDDILQSVLSKLSASKEMNVVVIGQSGVGKSTWINSIINYLTYDSFDSARDHGVICTIPLSFTVTDPKTRKVHNINVGKECANEVTKIGHSSTQFPRTYSFLWEGRCIRIIDTPGLVDSRGFGQDQENLRNIFDHLSYLEEIHAICILIKASDNTENPIFTYCINELLVNLNKSVSKNIIFCFTNSRAAMYSTGQASAILKSMIERLKLQEELKLGQHNMFSLDNEAFQFLCCLQYTDIQYEEVIRNSYEKSWEISSNATRRLFETIKTFDLHRMKETLSLVDVRARILSLVKPVAEVTKTIQLNLTAMQRKETEIKTSRETVKGLKEKLTFSEIQLESVALERPRTVCTSSKCIEYLYIKSLDMSDIIYKTHCHTACYLENVTPKTTNNAELRNCDAMNWLGKCTVCGCPWSVHMHVTYDQKRVEKEVENEVIKNDMEKEELQMRSKEDALSYLKSITAKYQQEQEIIITVAACLGIFLKNNAIATYNDSVLLHLDFLITQEENKPYKTEAEEHLLENLKKARDNYKTQIEIFQKLTQTKDCGTATETTEGVDKTGLLENLEKARENYKTQIEALQEIMTDDRGASRKITPDKVYELENILFDLELTGKQIRQSVEQNRASRKANMEYVETPVQIIPKKKKTWLWK